MTNPCIRCGKERIVVETYTENVETSVVVHTITQCPDPECQKKVEIMLAKEKEKREINLTLNAKRTKRRKTGSKKS